jgi:hypothetical protein
MSISFVLSGNSFPGVFQMQPGKKCVLGDKERLIHGVLHIKNVGPMPCSLMLCHVGSNINIFIKREAQVLDETHAN